MVAHDTLEHFWDGKNDRWEDELLALGAMTFIRWQPGFFSGRHRMRLRDNLYRMRLCDNIYPDLYQCLHFCLDERPIKPLKTNKLSDRYIDGKVAEITAAIEKMVAQLDTL